MNVVTKAALGLCFAALGVSRVLATNSINIDIPATARSR